MEWDLDGLARVGESEDAPFAVTAGFDDRWESARILSGAFEDGRLLAVAALRPRRARGHGDDAIGGALVREGEPSVLSEVLWSVEYDRERRPRRLGLELYEGPDSLPLRVAADRSDEAGAGQTAFDLRLDGVEGVGRLALLRP